ncbi:YopX family protein [Dysgonomonas capnocytophagoides]|uniref:YopX family protein n=1 Tax=Dysgonomonas capnocytophagoides TaxID=45254 RepID=UPI0030C86C90
MRQIKFRGKRNDQSEWVFGDLIEENGGDAYIVQANIIQWKQFEVDPDTVSQFTGLTDKNGKEIYEGDIIEDKNGIGVIMWFQTSWGVASYAHGYNGVKSYTAVDSFYCDEVKEWAVIGNIFDNPELLNEKQ